MNTSKLTAMVLRNTVDYETTDVLTMDIYFDEVKEPTIIIVDENKQLVDWFRVVAVDHEEIDCMVKNMIFYTDSIPSGEVGRQYGEQRLMKCMDVIIKKEYPAGTDYSRGKQKLSYYHYN